MWPFGFGWKMHRRRGLRMWILSLLARSAKNGAEIMDAIEEMSQGWWRPSPGSIYPLLEELQHEGLIQKKEDGRYRLTKQAQDEIGGLPGMSGGRPHGAEEMLRDVDGYLSYFEDLSRSDKSRLQPYRDNMRKIAERFSALLEEVSRSE